MVGASSGLLEGRAHSAYVAAGVEFLAILILDLHHLVKIEARVFFLIFCLF
jgi:hypothetical protein